MMGATKRFVLNGFSCSVRQAVVQCRFYHGITSVAKVDGLMAISVRPERAIKKAMSRVMRSRDLRNKICPICNRHMGDDIECYRPDCDDQVIELMKNESMQDRRVSAP